MRVESRAVQDAGQACPAFIRVELVARVVFGTSSRFFAPRTDLLYRPTWPPARTRGRKADSGC